MKFKEFLSESPTNIGEITSNKFRTQSLEHEISLFQKLSNFKTRTLGSFHYFEKNNRLYFMKNNELVLYIIKDLRSSKSSLFVKVIEKLSDEKNLSFKIYSLLLSNNVFQEIITGDSLSSANQEAHLKNINKESFIKLRFFLRKNDEDTIINYEDLKSIFKKNREDELIVLKESYYFRAIHKMYTNNEDLETVIEECLRI